MAQTYFSDSDMDAAANVSGFDPKDETFQKVIVSYMYGISKEATEETIPTLSEAELANAFDYYLCKDLDMGNRLSRYEELKGKRELVESEYALSPLDAILKRDEAFYEKPSLGDALQQLEQESASQMQGVER